MNYFNLLEYEYINKWNEMKWNENIYRNLKLFIYY